MKRAFSIVLKQIVLTIVLFICFAVAGGVVEQGGKPQTPAEAAAAASALLLVCVLDTSVLTFIIVGSRWAGWRLMATVFFVFYGVMTFMSQIESAVFLTRLPPGMLPRLFLMGAIVAAPYSALAVLILGKIKAETTAAEPNTRLVMGAGEWAWKLSVLAVVYVVLYFTFGYFVAWRNPAVREYYGGVDPGGFVAQMISVASKTWWLIPFQLLRGLLWALLAVPVVRMMKGPWQQTALAIGLLFAVVMNAQLLLPNPFMPETVRLTHLVETASSNFIFGLLAGGLLARSGRRPRGIPASVDERPPMLSQRSY
jgi:hypothetical protein